MQLRSKLKLCSTVGSLWFDEAMEQAFDDGIQQVRPALLL
jgi:hypothetical protein